MNLFFKSYKFYLIFFLTGLLNYAVLLGQESQTSFGLVPETIEFEIPSRYNRTPNTSFCRNEKGVYFIGKEDGFLAIDAGKVVYRPMSAPVYLARLASGQILYLTESDFGLLKYSLSEGPKMISRKERLVSHFPDYYPTGILTKDSVAFLATTEGIFVVTDHTTEHFFFNRQPVRLYDSGKQIFLQAGKMGLFQWDENEFRQIIPAEVLNNQDLAGIMDRDNNLLLLRREASPLWYNKETGKISNMAKNAGPAGEDYEDVYLLYGEHYIGKNNTNELFILSGQHAPVYLPIQENDLQGSRLRDLFVDDFADIWIVSDFNILKMEYPSRSYTIDVFKQLGSFVISATFHKDGIYLATTSGIYLLEENENGSWTPVPLPGDRKYYFHRIHASDNLIIATGASGTFQVDEGSLTEILTETTDCIKILDDHSFIGCNNAGIFRSTEQQGAWTTEIVDSSIHRITAHAECDNATYILTGNNEIFRLDKDEFYKVGLELPADDSFNNMLSYNGGLVVLGEKNIYSWDLQADHCIPVKMSKLQAKLISSDIVYSSKDHLWSISRDATGGSTLWMLEEGFIHTPYYEILAKRSFGQVLDIDEVDKHLWITGNKRLLRINIETARAPQSKLLRIQSVSLSKEGQPGESRILQPGESFRYHKQDVVFGLKNIRYQKAPYPYYRYKLSHYQGDWSEWSRNSNIVIEDPWERKYTFEAQSVSSYGVMSEPVTFTFTVTPPFYRTWAAYIFYFLVLFTMAFLLYKWRLLSLKRVEYRLEERIKERMKAVLSEKEKSDKLVADLFPKGTAEELKSRGRATSKKFELVTVLFSDIQGFTRIAEEMNPEILIDELDKFFFHFDSVVDKYNIEKIKTIGDAYMAAGGIPVKNSSNPVEVVLAGLEMQYYMKTLKKEKADIWDLRIGIHTGPVISGVVGHKKLSYDIWGDTVNTASRMESSGEGGKVNISGITYTLVKDFFICEYRGKLPVKYKGNIDMYFVTGLRPELSVDLHGIPNRRFFIKLQMLRIKDLEEKVFELIASNMNLNLHFHKKEYIHRVCNQAELLGRSENISDDELLLSQTAALMLFSGLSETYDHFENASVDIVRQILPEFGYDEKQIDRVCNLILATKEPFLPQNTLESIMIDAKMEYIGRSDYLTQVKLLYMEKKNAYRDLSREKFLKQQVELISNFNYYTLAAQRLREVTPENQLGNLQGWK